MQYGILASVVTMAALTACDMSLVRANDPCDKQYWTMTYGDVAYFLDDGPPILSERDRAEILKLVAKETNDPVLGIQVLDPNQVKVKTGVVTSPLSGAGQYFTIARKSGVWTIISTARWVA